MAQPPKQVCPICAYDDDVQVAKVDDDWVMWCENPKHPPYEWRPVGQYVRPASFRTGLGEEWGVYDDLLVCVHGGLAEYGVIEHRFAARARKTYDMLVARYGHTALAPSKYTVSSFLGGALGALWREGSIAGVWAPATGYWSYNSQVGAYGPTGCSDDDPILSWEEFATNELGVDPYDWPALGYVDSTGLPG